VRWFSIPLALPRPFYIVFVFIEFLKLSLLCEGLWEYQCEREDKIRRSRETMDMDMENGHAVQTESPFVMPQEDIEALHSSQAFCALRGHLAADAE
jgi:hypothetical protein